MSIYNVLAKNSITTPFIQFSIEQGKITTAFNNIFEQYLNSKKIGGYKESKNFDITRQFIDNNVIIYNNEKIILFNFMELFLHKGKFGNELIIRILHPMDSKYLNLVNCLYSYYNEFVLIMNEWNIIFNKFNGVEFTPPLNQINLLKQQIMLGTFSAADQVVIPFHEHFKKYLTNFSSLMMKDLNEFVLTISFKSTDISTNFTYTIQFLEDSNTTHSICEDVVVEKHNIDEFLKNLFFYGKLGNNI